MAKVFFGSELKPRIVFESTEELIEAMKWLSIVRDVANLVEQFVGFPAEFIEVSKDVFEVASDAFDIDAGRSKEGLFSDYHADIAVIKKGHAVLRIVITDKQGNTEIEKAFYVKRVVQ